MSIKQVSLKPVVHRAANELVYESVRDAISGGQFEPGEKLSTRKIAGELGVSQMPVREAFQRLVAEGAMVKRENRTITLPELTLKEFKELTEIRLSLEGLAATRAAKHANARQKKRLRALVEQMDEAVAADDRARHLVVNREFHFQIYEAADSGALYDMIELLWLRVGPLLRLNAKRRDTVLRADKWHAQAAAAIEAGDGEQAANAIRMDLSEAAKVVTSSMLERST
ncbi:HTH-type transcriptional regulator McbR [Marinovum algicola]|uniref:DNA-binding transcriptional regulator, GntR family n=1 Tax=Marinovum algicola TaxID=42444 RepID=A0A975WFG5_9RHOB|nr:GntR family transcriptional regulator [Marinovum algicola]SEK11123.1 DNA-binding transcriptional regulator, GntR family [Marinovum algicola]SLN71170.1 HTH-type transcriptional regulator McbR [Marinovum algicola]